MELFKEEFANEQVPLPEIKRPCSVCKKDSPYQCPKCKWFYCNLQCYQKHNLNCTEEFYKENVIEHLKGKKVSKEEAKKMQKILDNVKQKEDDLECLSDAQHLRFEELLGLLEQGELTLDSLKPAELQQFSMFLSDKNNLQGLIKEWEPWWENEDFVYNLDIEELSQAPPQLDNEKENKLFIYRQELKDKYNKLPPFNKLLAKDPSPELINHIVQFIFACTYLCREYNGDLKNCCDTVVPSLLAIAKCLHEKVTLPSVQISLDTTLANVMHIDGKDATPFIEIALTDLAKILENRFYVFEVCFRFYDVVHRYYEFLENIILKQEKDQKAVAKCQVEKKKISALKQKLLFYLSYLRTRTSDEFTFIKNEVKLYTRERMKNEALHQEMEKIVRNYDQNIRIH